MTPYFLWHRPSDDTVKRLTLTFAVPQWLAKFSSQVYVGGGCAIYFLRQFVYACSACAVFHRHTIHTCTCVRSARSHRVSVYTCTYHGWLSQLNIASDKCARSACCHCTICNKNTFVRKMMFQACAVGRLEYGVCVCVWVSEWVSSCVCVCACVYMCAHVRVKSWSFKFQLPVQFTANIKQYW